MDYTFTRLMETVDPLFNVGLIMASEIFCCAYEQRIGDAFNGHDGIDQLGVQQNGQITGVVEIQIAKPEELVSTHFILLNPEIQIDVETNLAHFLNLRFDGDSKPYRVVMMEGHPHSIVTKSDINKVPMKAYIFMHISHLEKQLHRAICRIGEINSDEAIEHIISTYDPDEWKSLDSYYKSAKNRDNYISLLDSTSFFQKVILLSQADRYKRDNFNADLSEAKVLRNWVSHTSPFSGEPQTFEQVQVQMGFVLKWIDKLKEDDRARMR